MASASLVGKRVFLRPLRLKDFPEWSEVRTRNSDWLVKWEPQRQELSNPDVDKNAFAVRCNARDRDWQYGAGFGFGIFVNGSFAGEANLNSVQRGPFQGAQIGYWVDEALAGNGYIPESVVLLLKFAFENQYLNRVEVAIVPRNKSSVRVAEKLQLRNEGIAKSYLEINGVWEDHVRFAITAEEWKGRASTLFSVWL